jgi:hypothetical protein
MRCEKFKNTLWRKASRKIVFRKSFTAKAVRDYRCPFLFNRLIQLIEAAVSCTKRMLLLNSWFIIAVIIHRSRFFLK